MKSTLSKILNSITKTITTLYRWLSNDDKTGKHSDTTTRAWLVALPVIILVWVVVYRAIFAVTEEQVTVFVVWIDSLDMFFSHLLPVVMVFIGAYAVHRAVGVAGDVSSRRSDSQMLRDRDSDNAPVSVNADKDKKAQV